MKVDKKDARQPQPRDRKPAPRPDMRAPRPFEPIPLHIPVGPAREPRHPSAHESDISTPRGVVIIDFGDGE